MLGGGVSGALFFQGLQKLGAVGGLMGDHEISGHGAPLFLDVKPRRAVGFIEAGPPGADRGIAMLKDRARRLTRAVKPIGGQEGIKGPLLSGPVVLRYRLSSIVHPRTKARGMLLPNPSLKAVALRGGHSRGFVT